MSIPQNLARASAAAGINKRNVGKRAGGKFSASHQAEKFDSIYDCVQVLIRFSGNSCEGVRNGHKGNENVLSRSSRKRKRVLPNLNPMYSWMESK